MGQSSVTACWSITVTTPPPWRTGEATELFTTDTMVEGVHFNRNTTPWTDLGWKSLASNISDIAAMGGLPMYALVTLGLPPETEVEDLKELYAGMMQISKNYGVAIVGGDLVRSRWCSLPSASPASIPTNPCYAPLPAPEMRSA